MAYDFERQAAVEQALVKFLGLPGRCEDTKRKSLEFLAMWDAVVEHIRKTRGKAPSAPPLGEGDDATPLTTSTPPAASSTA